jgi:hypothetical protein
MENSEIKGHVHDWMAEHITKEQMEAWVREAANELIDKHPEGVASVEDINALVTARVQAEMLDRRIFGRRLVDWLTDPDLED